PLQELDPSIPHEVVTIIERALRKDPAERFLDLAEMRSQLEQVHRGFAEEVQRIRTRLQGRLEEVRDLEAALAERVGSSREDETQTLPDERGGRLVALRALEGELADRLKTGQAKVAQAEALAPALQRALALLQRGEFAKAVPEFEAIAVQMPDHWRALEGLAQARAGVGAQQHVERQEAEAALAAQEARKDAQRQAEHARGRMVQARIAAETQAAAEYAPDRWNDGERRAAEGQSALERDAYSEATHAFDVAAGSFRRSEEAAREAKVRELEVLERARQEVTQGQQRAQAAGAVEHAR